MRSVPEWIADHDDQAVPRYVKLRVFNKHNGKCPKCTRTLRAGQWDCDHIIALANNGKHRETNLQPLCISPCHSDKTRQDRKIKARADRAQKSSAGIRKPRTITRWRNFKGEIVTASRER